MRGVRAKSTIMAGDERGMTRRGSGDERGMAGSRMIRGRTRRTTAAPGMAIEGWGEKCDQSLDECPVLLQVVPEVLTNLSRIRPQRTNVVSHLARPHQ